MLLDMDDTLFLEHSYVLSGIAAVARFLAPLTFEPENEIKARLSYRFLKFGRRQLFDAELSNPAVCRLEQIVDVYRNHLPQVSLFEHAATDIQRLAQTNHVGLVTDGAMTMQTRKVKALGLDKLIPHIVYCAELNAPKPQPTAFLHAARMIGVEPAQCLVIGDDPTADMPAADLAGMACICVMTGRYSLLRSDAETYGIASTFHEAVSVLTN